MLLSTLLKNSNESVFRNLTIEVDSKIFPTPSNYHFEHCHFIFKSEGYVQFTKSYFVSCKFQGEPKNKEHKYSAVLMFISCTEFSTINFLGGFQHLLIHSTEIRGLNDTSNCTNYIISEGSSVHSFLIKGRCESIDINGTFFTSTKVQEGKWDKEIIKSAKCIKTIFEKVQVNPFYLATKCDDKSSLDLTSATLIDNWSMLRKNYAGISLIIIIALTLVFFLPLITHSFFLMLSSKIDISLIPKERTSLWSVLLFGGKSGFSAIFYATLTIILLLYNLGRIWMTITIAKLREEEKFLADSNFQLVSIHPEKYKSQLFMHGILKLMLLVSVGYSILKIYDTMLIQVPNF